MADSNLFRLVCCCGYRWLQYKTVARVATHKQAYAQNTIASKISRHLQIHGLHIVATCHTW